MPTLSESVSTFLKLDRSPLTNRSYEMVLLPMCNDVGGKRSLKRITLSDLVDYAATLRMRDISQSTFAQYLTIIRIFFNWCVSVDYIRVSPGKGLTAKKGDRPPPEDYAMPNHIFKAILELARARATLGQPRDYAILCLIADTACRVNAIATLPMANLDLNKRCIQVIEKGNKNHVAYFTDPETEHALRMWLIARHRLRTICPTLFVSLRAPHHSLSSTAISNMIDKLVKVVDPTATYRAHSIRHWVAERYDAAGYDAATISDKLGNSPEIAASHYQPSAKHRRAKRISDKMPFTSMLEMEDSGN